VLCTAWAAGVPVIYHFFLPKRTPGQPDPPSPLYIHGMNISTISATEIAKIPSTSVSSYLQTEEYKGEYHPIDGSLVKYHVMMPLGYLLWGFASIPSWLMMIGISFVSRKIMARRMPGGAGGPTPPAAQRQAQPRQAPAAAAAPPSGGRSGGSAKKRR